MGPRATPPCYTIVFNNAILNTFINDNIDVNIKFSMCCKDVKDATLINVYVAVEASN